MTAMKRWFQHYTQLIFLKNGASDLLSYNGSTHAKNVNKPKSWDNSICIWNQKKTMVKLDLEII